ncbi:L-fucose mutarotase [Virgibacillus proomii]|uniref:L-fucose mutarotase n=1 Tax=Virgibacillus proomii TaxID=84407 RepID=UPI001C109A38|nr:L-fucose mutarotase [Virgibacillus proomii]MBU5266869.1 L-fucose mutarotase [Virgibacillus proomii]
MLKNIPKNLSPKLMKVLMEMGHGDEIVLSDANYPAHALGKRVVRADGLNIPDLLESILKLFPLDSYSDYQAGLMKVEPGDDIIPDIWDKYKEKLELAYPRFKIKEFERFEFYEHSKDCFAIVLTGETALYGNLILKKGVI